MKTWNVVVSPRFRTLFGGHVTLHVEGSPPTVLAPGRHARLAAPAGAEAQVRVPLNGRSRRVLLPTDPAKSTLLITYDTTWGFIGLLPLLLVTPGVIDHIGGLEAFLVQSFCLAVFAATIYFTSVRLQVIEAA